jgi:hypothetical protein
MRIKRIKNKEDLIDALCMIHEDMATFKLVSSDTINKLSTVIDAIRGENQ